MNIKHIYKMSNTENVEKTFIKATKEVHKLVYKPSNDNLLNLYGLYKQATEGDNANPEPWQIQFTAWRKWEAWDKNFGLTKTEAMKRYINIVRWLENN